MIKFLIWGIGGRLGNSLLTCLQNNENASVVGGVDKYCDATKYKVPIFKNVDEINVCADVIVDFSRPESIYDILPYAQKNKLNVVIATTGHTPANIEYINSFKDKLAIFMASNMSLGINLMIDLVRRASKTLGDKFDIEIIEQHHNIKVDCPSGTALSIAKAINEEFDNKKVFNAGRQNTNESRKADEIGIHSVRGGTIVGKHKVMFIGNDEIITVTHEASSKAVFAEGAIKAGLFLQDKPNGMYDMIDIIKE